MLKIKENNGVVNIISSLNKFRKVAQSEFGDKVLSTDCGIISVNGGTDLLNKIENKLRYSNLKKLILYLCYRITKDDCTKVEININEFLDLKNQQRQTSLTKIIIEDLNVLEKIMLSNFSAYVKSKEVRISSQHPILEVKNWEEVNDGYTTYIDVAAGEWANTLIDIDQFAFIPSEIFTFNKLEFDIAFNILMRLRYQQHKNMRLRKTTVFNLSVKYLLKGVDIPLVDKYGPSKVIKKIEGVLNKLQNLNWFKWNYREDFYSLPGRNIFKEYIKFMIVFDINQTILGKAYNLEKNKEVES